MRVCACTECDPHRLRRARGCRSTGWCILRARRTAGGRRRSFDAVQTGRRYVGALFRGETHLHILLFNALRYDVIASVVACDKRANGASVVPGGLQPFFCERRPARATRVLASRVFRQSIGVSCTLSLSLPERLAGAVKTQVSNVVLYHNLVATLWRPPARALCYAHAASKGGVHWTAPSYKARLRRARGMAHNTGGTKVAL